MCLFASEGAAQLEKYETSVSPAELSASDEETHTVLPDNDVTTFA